MKLSTLAFATMALLAPAGAQAATTVTFNGACAATATLTQAKCSTDAQGNTVLTGNAGNSATIYGSDPTLGLKITAWQGNQTTNVINSAFLGAYGGGFGVTGNGDSNGAGNLHQIDNSGGYTDFVLLQFSRAVHLEGANVTYYGINSVYDADTSFYNATGVTNTLSAAITSANWNSTINLASGYTFQPSSTGWSTTATSPDNATGAGTAYRTNTATGFSQVWLVSASVLATDRDDGFKLSQLTVTQIPPIPEPATWAMMIVGFGVIGATLRRRSTVTARFA